ncbi:hypothetical protein PFISCL1PPCAC_26756, partial [Pristionchus fissidentatus]
ERILYRNVCARATKIKSSQLAGAWTVASPMTRTRNRAFSLIVNSLMMCGKNTKIQQPHVIVLRLEDRKHSRSLPRRPLSRTRLPIVAMSRMDVEQQISQSVALRSN